MSFISHISQQYGLDEAAIRFLLGQIFGYPIFLFYVLFVRKLPLQFQYLYIFTTGACVAYWSFGFECICHGLGCIIIGQILLKFGPRGDKYRFYTAGFIVLFQFTYLLVGYWHRQKWEYESAIDWTTPHCIMVLRLMAIPMDFYDGNTRYFMKYYY